jgi:hypothetical protein
MRRWLYLSIFPVLLLGLSTHYAHPRHGKRAHVWILHRIVRGNSRVDEISAADSASGDLHHAGLTAGLTSGQKDKRSLGPSVPPAMLLAAIPPRLFVASTLLPVRKTSDFDLTSWTGSNKKPRGPPSPSLI